MPHLPTNKIALPRAGVLVPVFMRGARVYSLCSFEKHTSSTKSIPIILRKKKYKPSAGFPPSLRLKELQTKPTPLIPTERLQEISWHDFWRSHAPRGASIMLNQIIKFYSPWNDQVVKWSTSDIVSVDPGFESCSDQFVFFFARLH